MKFPNSFSLSVDKGGGKDSFMNFNLLKKSGGIKVKVIPA
jgi:hypothetical protein